MADGPSVSGQVVWSMLGQSHTVFECQLLLISDRGWNHNLSVADATMGAASLWVGSLRTTPDVVHCSNHQPKRPSRTLFIVSGLLHLYVVHCPIPLRGSCFAFIVASLRTWHLLWWQRLLLSTRRPVPHLGFPQPLQVSLGGTLLTGRHRLVTASFIDGIA